MLPEVGVSADSGEEQRLIKTLPRKGFRFVGQVRESREAAGPNPGDVPEGALAVPDKPSSRWRDGMDSLPNILFTALCCMALRHPNTGCIMPTLTRRSSQSFGRSGFVSPCPI